MSSDHISATTDPGYWTHHNPGGKHFDLALVFAASHKAKL